MITTSTAWSGVTTAVAAPPTGTTGIFLDGEPGEWVSGGEQWPLLAPAYSLTATGDPASTWIEVMVTGPESWRVALDAPAGDVLEAGRSYSSTIGVAPPGTALMYVNGDGRGCARAEGGFTIQQLEITPDGDVQHLDVDFWNKCDNGRDKTLYGSVRVDAARPLAAVTIEPDALDFGRALIGVPNEQRVISVVNEGDATIAWSSVSIDGEHAGDFDIVGDTCGATLSSGEACALTVAVAPTARGDRTASLVIDDDTWRSSRSIATAATSFQPTSVDFSIESSSYGTAGMRLKARVTPNPGSGDVDFRWTSGTDVQHTATIIDTATGVADVDLMTFPGVWEVTAVFGEHGYYAESADGPITHEIRWPTTTTLQPAAPTLELGQSASLTAEARSIYGPLPAGTLSIEDGGGATLDSRTVQDDDDSLTEDVCCLPIGTHDFSASYVPTGYGIASDGTASVTVVAAAPPEGSVAVASGTTYATSPAVAVSVLATDAVSGVGQVALSNDGAAWTTRTYAASQAWTLPAGNGNRTVYAKWRDNAGNWSSVKSDAIVLDTLAPSGTVTIAGGRAIAASTAVTIAVPAADTGSGVSHVALSNNGTSWTTRPYAASQPWTLPATNGTRTVHVKWQDGASNWSAVKTDTIVLDTVAPTVTEPRRGLVAATTIDAGRITLRVPWSGSDATSGIARYELAQSTDGGAWTTVSTTLTSPTATRSLATQHTYRFRVRAVDKAGTTGAWATGPTFSISRYSEFNDAITYGGSWTTVSSTAYWGGGAKKSSTAGAEASLTFTGRSFAWVARTGPDRGKATIYINGTNLATVDLYSATAQAQRVVWVGTWSTSVLRNVTVRVAGTSGRPRIDLDALVTAN